MKDLKNKYNRDGFVIVENFLSAEEVQQILKQFDRLIFQKLNQKKLRVTPDLFENLKIQFSENLDDYLASLRSFSRIEALNRILNNEKVYEYARQIGIEFPTVPTSPVVHLISDSLKIPGGYFGQGVHQDWTSMQGSLNSLGVWIALTDVSENCFPVEVIPKSHLGGIAEGEVKADYFEINPKCYREEDFVPVKMKKGTAMFFSSFLIHRTGLNNMKGFRVGVSYRFDDGAEETFVKRGYPTVYKRTVERKLLETGFPKNEQVLEQFMEKENT
ncbi:MAG: phytanoyl-CoA dioxygenase family protein [Bdellovibrionaceae bacterium]|nr:phytanoyl-CoA dioxygenase family protein [Pseudobdellovibrionaceae bacterium]